MYGAKFSALEKKIMILCLAAIFALSLLGLFLYRRVCRRTTYVITDGSRVSVHTTSATDPRAVLGEAGLELGEDDTYTTGNAAGVEQIHIHRGQTLRLDYYGQAMSVTGAEETVGQLLTRLGLRWEAEDIITPAPDTEIYEGMEVRIARVVRENQVYTRNLPHETITCTDDTLPAGQEKVLTQGLDGQLLCEATVTYHNGVETERAVLSQQVISQPVSAVIAVGTGNTPQPEKNPDLAQIGENTITLPTGEILTYTEKVTCLATAYCCEGYVGTTATGTRARVGAIAVDPEVFPYGTRFYIVTRDGAYIYGVATAEDCGSKEFIYGTRLDLYFNSRNECIQFGARSCDVYILG